VLNPLSSRRALRDLCFETRALSEGVHALLRMVTTEFYETLSRGVLTQEGAQIPLEGSHEARVWNTLLMKEEGTYYNGIRLKTVRLIPSFSTSSVWSLYPPRRGR